MELRENKKENPTTMICHCGVIRHPIDVQVCNLKVAMALEQKIQAGEPLYIAILGAEDSFFFRPKNRGRAAGSGNELRETTHFIRPIHIVSNPLPKISKITTSTLAGRKPPHRERLRTLYGVERRERDFAANLAFYFLSPRVN